MYINFEFIILFLVKIIIYKLQWIYLTTKYDFIIIFF